MNIIHRSKLLQLYIVTILLTACVTILLFFLFPTLQATIVEEDMVLEDASALFYLVAFILGTFYLIKNRQYKYPRQYIILPLLALLFFLDEIGFGLRFLIGTDHILLLGRVKVDGIHDSFEVLKILTDKLRGRFGNTGFLGISGLIAIAFIISFIYMNRRFSLVNRFRDWALHNIPLVIFLSSIIVFFLIATLLDGGFYIAETSVTRLFEELPEFCASIATLFCMFYLRTLHYPSKASSQD